MNISLHCQVPDSLHEGADRKVGERVSEGKLHLKAEKVRTGSRVEFAREHYQGGCSVYYYQTEMNTNLNELLLYRSGSRTDE